MRLGCFPVYVSGTRAGAAERAVNSQLRNAQFPNQLPTPNDSQFWSLGVLEVLELGEVGDLIGCWELGVAELIPSAKSPLRYHAPYMEWAKTRAATEFDLAGSNIMACSLDDLPGARDAVDLGGRQRQRVPAADRGDRRALRRRPRSGHDGGGTPGRTFSCSPHCSSRGTRSWWSVPGTTRCSGAARLFGASTVRFDRAFDEGFALDPDPYGRR